MSRGAKIAIAVVGVAVVALAIVAVVLDEHAGEGHSSESKRIVPEDIARFDTIVFLPAAASGFTVSEIEDRMDRLDAVEQYAEVPRGTLATLLRFSDEEGRAALVKRACAETTRGYVVALADPTDAARRELASELGDDVTVRPVQLEPPQTEIFMRVNATAAQTNAVKQQLDNDPDVSEYRFLSHADAYEEFRRLFGDQPDLIKTEPADGRGLPESFRLTLRDDVDPQTVADTYEDEPGVDTINLPRRSGLPPAGLANACERD